MKHTLDDIDLTVQRSSPNHWERRYFITEIQISLIRKELRHLKNNVVQCQDTDASFASIENVLKNVKGGGA
jgi:hypothetical protein